MSGLKSYPKRLNRGGKWQWARHAHQLILNATSLGVQKQAALLLSSGRYLRVNAVAPDNEVSLDDVQTVEDLIAAARHQSRKAMPAVRKLIGHRAAEYKPWYRVAQEDASEEESADLLRLVQQELDIPEDVAAEAA